MGRLGRSVARGVAVSGVVAASVLGGCGQKDDDARVVANEPTCTGTQAISATNVFGMSLPMKTLALSFDDGPGARTAELSSYLAAQGVPSAFFVNGKMLAGGTAVLQQLVTEGHVVANHTQTHASLTGRSTGGAPLADSEIVSEIAQTDVLIAPFVQASRLMFRAPFGDFDSQTAAALQPSPMSKYVGPINWDVGDHMGPAQAADWDCWKPGADGLVLTPQQCGDLYVKEIDSVGRGIVLLHDPYFVDDDPAKGGTVDMVEYIVPILKAKGYTFVRLDFVPEIAALLPALPQDAGAGDDDAGGESSSSATPDSSATVSKPGIGAADAGARIPDPCSR